jgi:DNA phosphorothioation-dependent restriction protein DptH
MITPYLTPEVTYSTSILSMIAFQVSQIINHDLKSIFNKDDKVGQDQLMKTIRELKKHHSLFVIGGKSITKIKDKAFWELIQ